MMTCCCACSRPLVLSAAERAMLTAAARAASGIEVTEAAGRAVARVLVRMGYLIRQGRGLYTLTEHGRQRLAEISPDQASIAA